MYEVALVTAGAISFNLLCFGLVVKQIQNEIAKYSRVKVKLSPSLFPKDRAQPQSVVDNENRANLARFRVKKGGPGAKAGGVEAEFAELSSLWSSLLHYIALSKTMTHS